MSIYQSPISVKNMNSRHGNTMGYTHRIAVLIGERPVVLNPMKKRLPRNVNLDGSASDGNIEPSSPHAFAEKLISQHND
jgi:hypothetical protein